MKKWICMCLVLCMMMSGSAMAIGRAIPQENVEAKPFYINCFDLVGMSCEEVNAYMEENERELRKVQLDYTTYPDENGEMVQMLCGFRDNDGSGFGVYDLSVNLDFDGVPRRGGRTHAVYHVHQDRPLQDYVYRIQRCGHEASF